MKQYTEGIRRITRLLIYTLAVVILGWGFTSYKSLFAGLALGLFLGSLVILHTAFKVHRLGEAITQGYRRPGLGMATRLSLGALGAVLVLRYPEQFELAGLVIGLLLPAVFALGDAIYISLKNTRINKGKG